MLGLRACGKADVLRKRLNDYYNGDTDSSPKNVLSDEIAQLRKIVMSSNLQLKNENQRLKNEIQKLISQKKNNNQEDDQANNPEVDSEKQED